ncbi:MAG: amino acid ABC transporter permease [Patescibacteria group bacterium]
MFSFYQFWEILWEFKLAFLFGTFRTLWLSVAAIVLGTILGFGLALARRSSCRPIRWVAQIYVELFLAIPVLVLMIWIYYVMSPFFVHAISDLLLKPWEVAVISLALSLAAFASENFRAGIESVAKDQYEAAALDGASAWQTMWQIVLPQTILNVLPNLFGQYITVIKLSSLASVIAVYELLHTSNNISSTVYRPMEVYTIMAMIYLVMIMPMIMGVRLLEKQLQPPR